MNITGRTTSFAVLGHPVAHTLSPPMHNASFASLGLNAVYLAYDVAPDHLMEVLHGMAAMGFGGVNLTIPLKEVAFRGVDQLDASATLVGGVNTVQFTPEGMVGHSTDGYGFLRDIAEQFDGLTVDGRTIFVAGMGGAGRAAALVCAREGAETLILQSRNAERRAAVVREIEALGLGTKIIEQGDPLDADLVVNSTPVGMKPDDPPLLPESAFRPGQCVYDMIYVVPETAFMRPAIQAGARAANGIGMLLHQGARSFEIWTGTQADVGAMGDALAKHLQHRAPSS